MSNVCVRQRYPIAVIWREVFSGLLSNVGRMAALANCFDLRTGEYRNAELAQHLSTEEVDRSMRLIHELLWNDWISGSLEQQADVLLYLRDLSMNVEQIPSAWLESSPFQAIVPVFAAPEEQALFASNVSLIRKLLQNGDSFGPAAVTANARAIPASILSRVTCAVRVQYTNPGLSLKVLSETVNLSERHLRRLFRDSMGETFRQYLREFRVEEAACLLVKTTEDVKAIAGAVGYADRSHFSRDFRLLMGCTPLQFRKQQCGTAMSDLLYRKSVLAY